MHGEPPARHRLTSFLPAIETPRQHGSRKSRLIPSRLCCHEYPPSPASHHAHTNLPSLTHVRFIVRASPSPISASNGAIKNARPQKLLTTTHSKLLNHAQTIGYMLLKGEKHTKTSALLAPSKVLNTMPKNFVYVECSWRNENTTYASSHRTAAYGTL